ncbi:MAG TPA: ABC transporter permease [Pirellulaceae bacterium]|jgi:ABC-type lipoprotein release transport system permease subunit
MLHVLLIAAVRDTTPFRLSSWSLMPLVVGGVLVLLLGLLCKVPVRYNIRNLQVRWLTTLLTGFAFFSVIALLTVMLAFVNGMYKLTLGSGQPGNVIVLAEGSTDESFSNVAIVDAGDIELQPGVLRDEQNRPLASRETYVVVNQPVQVRQPGRPKGRFTQVRGVEDAELSGQVHGLSLYEGGQWFSPEGVLAVGMEQEAIQAVLGEGIARELGRDRKPEQLATAKNRERLEVGETFELGGRIWVAVGIIRSSGSTFDSEIWAKRDLIAGMFRKATYSSLVLRTAGPAEALTLKNYLNNEYEKAAVQAYTETEYFSNLSQTNWQFLISIIIVTSIMSLGGVFGVMNTMFAAVSQRSKDIGVLRILGFSRLHVQASFLLESLVLALVGGVAGCALGSLIHGTKAASIVGSGQGGGKFVVLEMVVSGDIIAVGLALSLAMGLFGGLIPSIRAMLVRPLESLR